MRLRVLERNLNFSERKLEGSYGRGKARLDAALAKSTMNGAYCCAIGSGKQSLCAEQPSSTSRFETSSNNSGSVSQFEVGPKPWVKRKRMRYAWSERQQFLILLLMSVYLALIPRFTRTAMSEIKPRYEFRVWAETLTPIRERLERLASPKETVSQEIYLVSATTDKCNAKIRAELMDIKLLVAEDRGLEQWNPILKVAFPLESSVVATQVFPSLELPPPVLAKSTYSLGRISGRCDASGAESHHRGCFQDAISIQHRGVCGRVRSDHAQRYTARHRGCGIGRS